MFRKSFFIIIAFTLVLAACNSATPTPEADTAVPPTDEPAPVIPTTEEEPTEETPPTPTPESVDLPEDNEEAVAGNMDMPGTVVTFSVVGSDKMLTVSLPEGWSLDGERIQDDADPFQRLTFTVPNMSMFDSMSLAEVAAQMEDGATTETRSAGEREAELVSRDGVLVAVYVRDSDDDLIFVEIPGVVPDGNALTDIALEVATWIEAE